MESFTESDLIEELQRALAVQATTPGAAWTAAEIREITGWARGKIGEVMRKLCKAGLWECVKVPRLMVTGLMRQEYAYRPKAKP